MWLELLHIATSWGVPMFKVHFGIKGNETASMLYESQYVPGGASQSNIWYSPVYPCVTEEEKLKNW